MPFYVYHCDNCRETFEIRHGMFFKQENCVKCHSKGFLFKVPSFVVKKKEINPEAPIGKVVNNYIKETKKELKKEKEKLKKEEL